MRSLREHFIRVQIFSGKACGSEKINSLGPQKSVETNTSKNSPFHSDKSFWPISRRFVESHKPQETIYGGPQILLTITVEHIDAFFKN